MSLHCYFRSHYKEYLVGLINKNKVDPVDIMGVQELERCFARRGKQAPKPRNESEGQYRKRLAQVIDKVAGQLGLKSTRPESTRPGVFSEHSVTYMYMYMIHRLGFT